MISIQWFRRVRSFQPFLLLTIMLFAPCILFAEEPKLKFGMSTALSGPAKALGEDMKLGFETAFEVQNQKGGVRGRLLELVALDDGYEPSRAAPNVTRLIDDEKVLAIVGDVGTPTSIAVLPIITEKKILYFAPFTGAGVLRRSPPDRYVINFRASYEQETAVMVDALIAAGIKPNEIAFFTQRDGYGDAGYAGGINALKRQGLNSENEVVHARYERNTLAVENALADIVGRTVTPKAVIMVGAYAPCTKFIKLSKQTNFNPFFLNVSFVGSEALARDLGSEGNGVIVTQVVPPYFNSREKIITELDDILKKKGDKFSISFGTLEGYISAKILIAALEKIKGEITSESIIDSLESLGEFSVGSPLKLSLSKDRHQASDAVWSTIIKDGHLYPFEWGSLKKHKGA